MEWSRLLKVLGTGRRDHDTAVLSRRETVAGIGLAGLFALAGSQILASKSAEARPVSRPRTDRALSPDDAHAETAEHDKPERPAADAADVTDLSAHRRRWRRRYWRRYYWRRRYWRPRYYWRRRYWRRRYWRRRYWRRRYWW
jgi:hypothetical protein